MTITCLILLPLGGWILFNVHTLTGEVKLLKQSQREDKAQWQSITDQENRLRKQEVNTEVLYHMWNILLDNQPPREHPEPLPEPIPHIDPKPIKEVKPIEILEELKNAPQIDPDEFRRDKIRVYEQRQQAMEVK
jgi:hypothetical protein